MKRGVWVSLDAVGEWGMCEVNVRSLTKGGGGLGVILAGTGNRIQEVLGSKRRAFRFSRTHILPRVQHITGGTELRDAQSLIWVVYD